MTFTIDEISTGSRSSAVSSTSFAASRAFFSDAAYKRVEDTASAVGREFTVVVGGGLLGAMDKCQKDPVGTALQVGASTIVGVGLGTLAVAESPVIAGGAVAAGLVTTGVWAANTFWPTADNQLRFAEMGRAVKDAWNSPDGATLAHSTRSVRDNGGDIAFDLGMMAFGSAGARAGANHGSWALKELARSESVLAPAAVRGYYESGWSGRGDLVPSTDDLALFQRRHGKVSTHKGTPDTVEAICKELDSKLDTIFAGQERKGARQVKVDWSHEVLVPPVDFGMGIRSFYFRKYNPEKR